MPTIHLVRHGEVSNPNHVCYADLPSFNLSSTGVLQAHAAGGYLAHRDIDRVITSPLARAVQTATAIARRHGLRAEPRVGLMESGQYPGWTGQRWDDIRSLFPEQIDAYLDDPQTMPDVHETIGEIAQRVVEAILDELSDGVDELVVVAHQDPIQAARLALVGRSLSTLLHDPPTHASVVTLSGTIESGWREAVRWAQKRTESQWQTFKCDSEQVPLRPFRCFQICRKGA